MKKTLFLVTILGCLHLCAAKENEPTAQFRGTASLKEKPDFVTVDITIRSECYSAPDLAQEETDKIVKNINDFLEAQKEKGHKIRKIIVNGGYTTPFSRWIKDQEFCKNTFQKDTQIVVEIGLSENFDKEYSELQSYVLKTLTQGRSMSEYNARTYPEISTPVPRLDDEHRKELLNKARNLALLDAKANFKAAIQSCKNPQYKIMSIREEGGGHYYFPAARSYAVSAKAESAPSVIAPVRLDDLKVEVTLDVTFGFDGASCYEP